jgi:hypothetical protein
MKVIPHAGEKITQYSKRIVALDFRMDWKGLLQRGNCQRFFFIRTRIYVAEFIKYKNPHTLDPSVLTIF